MFELHPQLAKDCHHLSDTDFSAVLIHKNAALPWFILVPKGSFRELHELPQEQMISVMSLVNSISRSLKQDKSCDKVNVAVLGNQVPQLHIHVIGRYIDDACWPNPIWGNLPSGFQWSEDDLAELTQLLPS